MSLFQGPGPSDTHKHISLGRPSETYFARTSKLAPHTSIFEFVTKIKFRIQLRYNDAAVHGDNLAAARICVAAFHHEGTCLSCSSVLSGRRDNLRGRLSSRGTCLCSSVCPFAPCGARQARWTGPARHGRTACLCTYSKQLMVEKSSAQDLLPRGILQGSRADACSRISKHACKARSMLGCLASFAYCCCCKPVDSGDPSIFQVNFFA